MLRGANAGDRSHLPRAAGALGIVLLAAATAPLPGAATPATGARATITAGTLRDWPPYYQVDEAGRPTGFAVEVLDAIAARAGFTVRYRTCETFVEMQRALAAGEIDVAPSLGVIEGRDFLFTRPTDTFDVGVFVRESSPGVRTPADVRGRVAAVESNVGIALASGLEGVEVVVLPDVREAIFRLLAGEFEALVFPSPVVWALARGAGVDPRLVELRPALGEVKRALATSRDRSELRDRLDAALAELIPSAEYRAIYRAWHAPPPPFWTARRVALAGGLLLVLLAVAVALWRHWTLRRFHRELAARERTFRALAEGLSDCVMIVEPGSNRIRYANSRSRELFGRAPDELAGHPLTALLDADLLSRAEGAPQPTRLERPGGDEIEAEIAVGPSLSEATPPGFLVRVADVTQRQRLEERLRQAEKLESVGRLAGGIAHDFNNLLTVIGGNVELALAATAPDDRRHRELTEVRQAADRAAALIQQLLAFSRKQVVQPRVVTLDHVLLELEPLLRRLLGERVTLVIRAGSRSSVYADPAQLEQVIVNLAVNGRDAMPGGGRLTLDTATVELPAGAPSLPPRVAPGTFVRLSVSDEGAGMDESTRRRIFEPFFTTKGPGEGTGLGLATVDGIVDQSGGFVVVESAPGAGSTFRVHLPRFEAVPRESEDPARVAAERAAARPARRDGETILLVEDEESLLRLFARALADGGYTVLAAGRPGEALRLAAAHDGPIDLLLTDVVLPEMNGTQLARRLSESRPVARVLYMSGYTEESFVDDGALANGAGLLAKPFSTSALVRAVRAALDG